MSKIIDAFLREKRGTTFQKYYGKLKLEKLKTAFDTKVIKILKKLQKIYFIGKNVDKICNYIKL